jgi:hypothetical protein
MVKVTEKTLEETKKLLSEQEQLDAQKQTEVKGGGVGYSYRRPYYR